MNAASKDKNKINFSFSEEKVHLDKDFPLDFFDYQVYRDTLSNLHCHDSLEFGVCQSGTGLFIVGNEVYAYKPGDMVFIGSGVYHRAHSNSIDDDLWTFFYLKAEDWGCEKFPYDLQLYFGRAEEPMLYYLLVELHTEMKEKKTEYQNICRGLTISILSYLQRINRNGAILLNSSNRPWQQFDQRINQSLTYMLDEKSEGLSISQIASMCNLSDSQFRKLFLQQTGLSPKEFQRKIRLGKALSMLQSSQMQIVDIAYECGFSSVCNFNRCFKENYKVSPSIWRKRHLKK